MSNEALSPREAKARILFSLTSGTLIFDNPHLLSNMKKRGILATEIVTTLRGGVVGPAEYENGSWRHQIYTARIVVVVTFPLEGTVVITAWRLQP